MSRSSSAYEFDIHNCVIKVKVISTFVLATFTFQTGSYHFQMAVFITFLEFAKQKSRILNEK